MHVTCSDIIPNSQNVYEKTESHLFSERIDDTMDSVNRNKKIRLESSVKSIHSENKRIDIEFFLESSEKLDAVKLITTNGGHTMPIGDFSLDPTYDMGESYRYKTYVNLDISTPGILPFYAQTEIDKKQVNSPCYYLIIYGKETTEMSENEKVISRIKMVLSSTKDYDDKEKIEVLKITLEDLEDDGFIRHGYTYDESNSNFEFQYSDGTIGGIMMKPFIPRINYE